MGQTSPLALSPTVMIKSIFGEFGVEKLIPAFRS
jgi:hypothetical protein